MIQTLEILKGYITCPDAATRNKFFNLLDSFWHKNDGSIVKSHAKDAGGNIAIVIQKKDGSTETINFPALPNSMPISFIEDLEQALQGKVNTVPGKGLSTNDFTTTLLNKLNSLQNYQHPEFHQIGEIEELPEALAGKQDAAPEGYGFSQEDFTTPEKEKLQKLDQWHYAAPVNDLLELAAIPMEERATKQRRYVHSEGVDYFYDASLLEGDLAPSVQVEGEGFWVKGQGEISVQDENGAEQFKFNSAVRFRGFSFNPAMKEIRVIRKLKEVVVQDKSQLLGELQSDVLYVIDGFFTLGVGESIVVPTGGLNIMGYSFDASNISSYNITNHTLFTSPAEGSGNLIIHNIAFTCTGTGAKVFDLVDSDGNHAIEMVTVNFEGCKSLGKLRNYRQGTGITIGIYGCADGLMLSGTWNGFKLTNTNCFAFAATGTLFKKDVDTLFSNRLFLELNMDLPAGSKLIDFVEANFAVNDLLQFNSTILKYNGEISDANAELAVPNIKANNPKCLWRSNVGLPDTAIEKFVDAEVAGAYAIDWLKDTFNIVMTANTTFTDKNLPAAGKSTKEIQIYLSGNFEPTFPAGWNANKVGTYKAGEVNKITLKFIKAGLYFMKIDNSLTIYPAPDLETTEPKGLYPNDTKEYTLFGSFFTPATIVSIEGHTVNNVDFVNSGKLILSVTTSAQEGDFDLRISNGTEVIFADLVTIAAGEIYIPALADWTEVSGTVDLTIQGEAHITNYNTDSYAKWPQVFPKNKNWSLRFNHKKSPLGNIAGNGGMHLVALHQVTDGTEVAYAFTQGDSRALILVGGATAYQFNLANLEHVEEFRCTDGRLHLYRNGILRATAANLLADDLTLRIRVRYNDIVNIKYIEYAAV